VLEGVLVTLRSAWGHPAMHSATAVRHRSRVRQLRGPERLAGVVGLGKNNHLTHAERRPAPAQPSTHASSQCVVQDHDHGGEPRAADHERENILQQLD